MNESGSQAVNNWLINPQDSQQPIEFVGESFIQVFIDSVNL